LNYFIIESQTTIKNIVFIRTKESTVITDKIKIPNINGRYIELMCAMHKTITLKVTTHCAYGVKLDSINLL